MNINLAQLVNIVVALLVPTVSFLLGKILALSTKQSAMDSIIKSNKEAHDQERLENRDFRTRIESKVDSLVTDVATLKERSNHPTPHKP